MEVSKASKSVLRLDNSMFLAPSSNHLNHVTAPIHIIHPTAGNNMHVRVILSQRMLVPVTSNGIRYCWFIPKAAAAAPTTSNNPNSNYRF